MLSVKTVSKSNRLNYMFVLSTSKKSSYRYYLNNISEIRVGVMLKFTTQNYNTILVGNIRSIRVALKASKIFDNESLRSADSTVE